MKVTKQQMEIAKIVEAELMDTQYNLVFGKYDEEKAVYAEGLLKLATVSPIHKCGCGNQQDAFNAAMRTVNKAIESNECLNWMLAFSGNLHQILFTQHIIRESGFKGKTVKEFFELIDKLGEKWIEDATDTGIYLEGGHTRAMFLPANVERILALGGN